MLRQVMLTGLFAGLLFTADAQAQDKDNGKRDPEKIFKQLDANSDGKVSLDEFKKLADKGKLKDRPELLDKIFKKLDANGDGSLTLEEAKKIREVGKGAKKKTKGA